MLGGELLGLGDAVDEFRPGHDRFNRLIGISCGVAGRDQSGPDARVQAYLFADSPSTLLELIGVGLALQCGWPIKRSWSSMASSVKLALVSRRNAALTPDTPPPFGTPAQTLLRVGGDQRLTVDDYVLDHDQATRQRDIPDGVWQAALATVDENDKFNIGLRTISRGPR